MTTQTASRDNTATPSLLGKSWQLRPADERLSAAISRDYDIPLVLARLLLSRDVKEEEIDSFLNPTLKNLLPNPSSFKDMDIAAERLAGAVMSGETIGILGDYDVDGATSSALLVRFFRELGTKTEVHIPDRIIEGYGPNTPAMLGLKDKGAAVIITVDCGTVSHEPLAAAHEAGVDVIVADHHLGSAERPKALAIVNPNRLDEISVHTNLAAVGVCFLLAVAVNRALKQSGYYDDEHMEPELLSLLDLVALGTICDVVPLTGVNRALVAQGLKKMTERRNLGLRTLMDVARIDESPNTYHAGFILGPRINAGGRVGCSAYGYQLLSTEDEAEALRLAKELDAYNTERKAIEVAVLEDAMQQAERQHNAPMIYVAGGGWHPGVIGIVAGRLKERFHKPAAVVAFENGTGKASCRSVSGFDFGSAIIAARQEELLVAGGGHAMAAGFTVEESKQEALRTFLSERVAASLADAPDSRISYADVQVALSGITEELVDLLQRAAPFGAGHANPKILVQHARVEHAMQAGDDHVRLILCDDAGCRLTAMSFRTLSTPFGQQLMQLSGKRIHAVGTVRMNHWQGTSKVSFTIDDVVLA